MSLWAQGAQGAAILRTKDRGSPRLHNGRSAIVGCWFIQRGREGQAVATGRIVKGVRAGEYMLAYVSRDPNVVPLTTATPEQMIEHNYELWAHEANWRRAYVGADAPRGTDEQLQR